MGMNNKFLVLSKNKNSIREIMAFIQRIISLPIIYKHMTLL